MPESLFSEAPEVNVDTRTITEINAALGSVSMEVDTTADGMSPIVARSLARTDAQSAASISSNGNYNGKITAFNSAI